MPTANRIPAISKYLLRWYSLNARDFPWRNTRNSYRILISEIMLQQTQASRVIEKYPPFLKRFPNFAALARAPKSSVIRAWRGMGYNNRAIRLQQLAQTVTREHGGKLPRTIDDLDALPGIGKYTSHAIACFAFGRHVPAVDTNVKRVLARLFPNDIKKMDIWELATAVLPRGRAFEWNQALFDFGAQVCTARNPKCEACPVAKLCPSAFKVTHSRKVSRALEPGRDGIPNRIYRGRVVEILRNLNGNHSLTLARLGKQIKRNYGKKDSAWLKHLLESLSRDNIVSVQHRASTLRVRLAK